MRCSEWRLAGASTWNWTPERILSRPFGSLRTKNTSIPRHHRRLGGFGRFTLNYSGRPGQSWRDCVLQLASVQGMIMQGHPQIHAVVTLDGRDGITRVGWVGDGVPGCFIVTEVAGLLPC